VSAAATVTPFFQTSKPFTRWWWFNERIEHADVERQLVWAAAQGFGGVEIAWVYPLPGTEPGPRWLTAEWTALVRHAKERCSALGLGCDFTLGSLWPFGDAALGNTEVSQWHTGPSPQRIDRHWQSRDVRSGPPVLDHLSRGALESYGSRVVRALAPALAGDRSCLFCDSWEVEEEGKLWTSGFGERFRDRFGYSIEPFMDSLGDHAAERYDYRALVSDLVLDEFYRPYAALCRSAGALSRVQCHGAPTDIVAAYAAVDIPESESLLFDPGFSRLAASAAALTGKDLVSCEAFTCLYGWNPWPSEGPHLGSEQPADLKLLADGLAANGVNRFVWHGMPFNPAGSSNRFYASVHVGPDGSLAPHLPALNSYLEQISSVMRQGRPAHRVACLLPLADAWMRGELPPELRKPSARCWWELQHPLLDPRLRPWSPVWVTDEFLRAAEPAESGALRIGAVVVPALVVDTEFVDMRGMAELARLATGGCRIVLARMPRAPGRTDENGQRRFEAHFRQIAGGARVSVTADPRDALRDVLPFLECEDCPEFFVREQDGETLLFAAHPATRGIRYPMALGAGARVPTERRTAHMNNARGARVSLDLRFAPGVSLVVRISASGSTEILPPSAVTFSAAGD
jgi:hypothetical protein